MSYPLDVLAADDDASVVLGLAASTPHFSASSALPTILCCLCGIPIQSNAANQCGPCLAAQYDLSSLLRVGAGGSDLSVTKCKRCGRWEGSGRNARFQHHEPEGSGLLGLCLRRIPALAGGASSDLGLKLTDAGFVWTEPHCMRLKVRLDVVATVAGGSTPVAQRVISEFIVRTRQCPECAAEFRKDSDWGAVVQLRQRRLEGVARGLRHVEAALTGPSGEKLRKKTLKVETGKNGFDFYFKNEAQARGFAGSLSRVVPVRTRISRRLVSSDARNNTANVKVTVACDAVPLARHDLVRLARRSGAGGALAGRLALVEKISGKVALVDASPARGAEVLRVDLSAEQYWRGKKNFDIIMPPSRLSRFVILDVEPCSVDGEVADVELAREADFGSADGTLRCVTHLGRILKMGDVAVGYDLLGDALSDIAEEGAENRLNASFVVPDVVLVAKARGEAAGADGRVNAGADGKPMSKREKRKQKRKGVASVKSVGGDVEELVEAPNVHKDHGRDDPEYAEELEIAEGILDALLLQDEEVGTDDNANNQVDSEGEDTEEEISSTQDDHGVLGRPAS